LPVSGDSPNTVKAAMTGINKDRRCAASLRTMPAWRTAAAIARNTDGSSTPSAAINNQLALGCAKPAS